MRQRVIAVVGVVALIALVFALNFYRLSGEGARFAEELRAAAAA